MSLRYKGAVISATPPTTTGGNSGTAPGAWTLQQQLQAQAAGNWPNQPIWYVEDVFSTYLYTGNGSTQTITNGIDLAGKGGLVWCKARDWSSSHSLNDTARGVLKWLGSDSTLDQQDQSNGYGAVSAFNSNGFSLNTSYNESNGSGINYASWTFRKQPKFFDVVTYTGNGVAGRAISHSLGSTPGCVIVKCTSSSTNWAVWHRGDASSWFRLNTTSASDPANAPYVFGNDSVVVQPTSTNFTVASDVIVNASGQTYVAYLFAHNAGGFGLTGTDNVISCGSFTLGTTTADVNLGWEPQWILFKRTNSASDWRIYDTMRGWTTDGNDQRLQANVADAEDALTSSVKVTSTGFFAQGLGTSNSYIYIAIRRGPMRTPTSGSSVFSLATGGSNNYILLGATNRNPDMALVKGKGSGSSELLGGTVISRLTGMSQTLAFSTGATTTNPYLLTTSIAAETTTNCRVGLVDPTITTIGAQLVAAIDNGTGDGIVGYAFKRAPGFFDVVCYTGTGTSGQAVSHNLGVAPELTITKRRNAASENGWLVWSRDFSATYSLPDGSALLNTNGEYFLGNSQWSPSAPTSTQFFLYPNLPDLNVSGGTYVTYLFATCPGVSNVGIYTGTGTTKQIDCGFTGGARFVLIKRAGGTGDWYVWDSARGIVAGNDPYLLLNSTAAEVTNTDYVDAYAAGFEISSTAPAAINANGGTFIYLAIA